MKKMLFALVALSGILLACGPCGCNMQKMGCNSQKSACGPKAHKSTKGIRPLVYALDIMKLSDNPELKLALQSYRMTLKGLERGFYTDAFKEGKFDRKAFMNGSYSAKKLTAQAELFETVYAVLDNKQKERLHMLMAADVYYNQQLRSECGCMGPCANKRACDGSGKGWNCDSNKQPCGKRACDGSGPNPDCPKKQ